MDILEALEPLVQATEEEMERVLQSATAGGGPADLEAMHRYHLGWLDVEGRPIRGAERRRQTGKRLRPALCLLCSQAVSGEWERALPAAAAVEFIHNFSLIHDDIEDNDRERRHRPTVWARWGVPLAINAGSHMQNLVATALLRLNDGRTPPAIIVEASHCVARAILRMTEGQHRDIRLQDELHPTPEDYWQMVAGKTAALVEEACRLGALLGGAGPEAAARFAEFGRGFGLAFQARDDYLGMWGDPATTGKPVAADLLQKKKSLPAVLALHRAQGADAEALGAYFTQPVTPARFAAAREALDRQGTRDAVQAEVQGRAGEAYAALERASPSAAAPAQREALALLRSVLDASLERSW